MSLALKRKKVPSLLKRKKAPSPLKRRLQERLAAFRARRQSRKLRIRRAKAFLLTEARESWWKGDISNSETNADSSPPTPTYPGVEKTQSLQSAATPSAVIDMQSDDEAPKRQVYKDKCYYKINDIL